MRRARKRLAALSLAALLPAGAQALEYRSLAEPALMFDAPSKQAQARFVVARATPVEIVVSLGDWVKVRDAAGDIVWLEQRLLSDKRTLIVTAAKAEVRREAADTAPIVFEAERDVLLDLLEPAAAGWARVRHRDGQAGYVRVQQVWGL